MRAPHAETMTAGVIMAVSTEMVGWRFSCNMAPAKRCELARRAPKRNRAQEQRAQARHQSGTEASIWPGRGDRAGRSRGMSACITRGQSSAPIDLKRPERPKSAAGYLYPAQERLTYSLIVPSVWIQTTRAVAPKDAQRSGVADASRRNGGVERRYAQSCRVVVKVADRVHGE